ncbi:sperm motility kinase 2A-like [Thomomys bottae]
MAMVNKVSLTSSSSEEEITIIGQYELKEVIGYGSFGYVKLAYHRLADTKVAMKFLLKKDLESQEIANEVDISKTVHHPHIIRLFEVMEDEECVYLVMELAGGGHLMGWILRSPRQRLFEFESRRLFQQIASAVHYLHERGIAHRDLKPNNILLDGKRNVKVMDFGMSVRLTPGERLKGICGAVTFRAPEVFLHQMYDGYKVDIWTLGVLLYVMATGKFPFEGRKLSEIRALVLEAKYEAPLYLSAKGHDLLSQMLTVDPDERPNIGQIMEHPWLDQGVGFGLGPEEPLPGKLDPVIVSVMSHMGYNLADTQEAIRDRAFNEAMGTYLAIRENIKENTSKAELQRIPSAIAPCPTPERLLPPGRRASAPARLQRSSLSSEYQSQEGGKHSPLKVRRSASVPAIPLSFLQSSSCSRDQDSVLFPGWPRNPESYPSQENALPSGQPVQVEASAFHLNNRWGWRRVADRVMAILRQLCCCVTAPM